MKSRALFRGFIDGSLSDHEQAELERSLRDLAQAKDFLRELHFDQAIRQVACSQQQRRELEPAKPSPRPITARIAMRRGGRWRRPLAASLALRIAAMFLMLAVPIGVVLHHHFQPLPPLAQLAIHLGTVNLGGNDFDGEKKLEHGDTLTVSAHGWASLRLRDSTLIELHGGSQVRIRDDAQGAIIDIAHGTVRANVAHQALGRSLRLITARSQTTVIGTRLILISETASDRIDVSEGLVHCRRLTDGATADVPAGNTLAINGTSPLVAQALVPPTAPIPEPPTSGMMIWLNAAQGIERDNDGRVVSWRDQSPLRCLLTQSESNFRPRVLAGKNHGVTAVRFAAEGEGLSCTNIWPDTSAFTVAVALRAHVLGNWSQTFGWGWGTFTFHSDTQGGVYTGVGAPGGGIRFAPGNGPEDIPNDTVRVGKWQRFVVTFGNGVGAFYADGRLVARKAMPSPGHWQHFSIGRTQSPANEPMSFAGDLAELVAYNRVLDAQELDLIERRLAAADTQ